MLIKLFFTFVLVTILDLGISFADIVYLKNGRQIEGKIAEETEQMIKLRIKKGILTLLKKDIASIKKEELDEEYFLEPQELYEKKLSQIDETSAQAHYELGLFCVEQGLFEQALREFNLAQKIDSQYESLVKSQQAQIEAYRAKKLYQTALSYYQSKAYFKALKYFNSLISNYPNSQLATQAYKIIKQIKKERIITDKDIFGKPDEEIVISVPTVYSTIAEALEEINLLGGGTIKIEPGIYNAERLILGKNVNLEGAGADKTKLILGKEGLRFKSLDKKKTEQVVIKDLYLQLKGEGIYLNHLRDITFQNCIITGGGKGFIIDDSLNIQIINCTLVNLLGGVYIGNTPVEVTIRNSIISGNKFSGIQVRKVSNRQEAVTSVAAKDPVSGAPIPLPSKETAQMMEKKLREPAEVRLNLFYNNIWGNFYNYYGIEPGKNDISKDPQFVGDGNFHLKPTSPCIDAGDPDPKYNDPDGSRADIGALPYLK